MRTRVGNDEHHLALPKLYGAPAYARPTVVPVAPVDRPFDPDDLPLEAAQTEEERELVAQITARPYASGAGEPVAMSAGQGSSEGSPMLPGRSFQLGPSSSRVGEDDGTATSP